MEQISPIFRVADAIRLPDREKHRLVSGQEPQEIDGVDPKFVSRATAQAEADASTLAFSASVTAHTIMSEICEAVRREAGLPESSPVFFDPERKAFWAFPSPAETQNA